MDYCANNLLVMILDDLYEAHPEHNQEEIRQKFMNSKTYQHLYNFTTHLWAEGPDYIREMFEEEHLIKIEDTSLDDWYPLFLCPFSR